MNNKQINVSKELQLIQKFNFRNLKKSNKNLFLGFANKLQKKDQHQKKYLKIREKLIKEVVVILNNFFNSDFDERFWRILIGPWISIASETFYNRYNSLSLTRKLKKPNKLIFQNIGDNNFFELKNTNDFFSIINDSNWNENIFYEISKDLKISNQINKKKIANKREKKNFSIKKIISKFIFLPVFLGKKLIVNTYMSRIDEYKLQIKLKHFPVKNLPDYFEDIKLPYKYDDNLRNKLITKNINKKDPNIYNCIKRLIFKSLPIIYLENFNYLKNYMSRNHFTNKLRLIVSAQNFDGNEYFKFIVAFSKLKNSKVFYLQHGNTDGVTRFDHYNNHMITPDKYLTWGWDKSDFKKNDIHQKLNIKKFCNIKISSYKKFSKKFEFENKIILYGFSPLTRRHFWDIDNENNRYIEFEINFLKKIKKEFKKKTVYKIHDTNLHNLSYIKKKFIKINPSIKIISYHRKISDSKNKLSIFSYDSTGFYEHLSLNKPCIIFMPDIKSELNYFGLKQYLPLLKNSIIFKDEEKMAEFINTNWDNILEWWYSPKIQKEIKNFSEKLTKYDENYFKKILTYFQKEL